MKQSLIKPILAGLIIGVAAFLVPFILVKLLFFFLIIGFIMRMFFWRRFYRGGGPGYYMPYTDRIRNMNDEEYNALKDKMKNRHYNYGHCCHYGDEFPANKEQETKQSQPE